MEVCTSGPHYAKLNCSECGRFIKFMPRPGGGEVPEAVLAKVTARTAPAALRGTPAQIKFAESCRDSILYRAKKAGLGILHSVALCVVDASWFIANKDRRLNEIRWPTPSQMDDAQPNQASA